MNKKPQISFLIAKPKVNPKLPKSTVRTDKV